jgi:hypothetical protein
MAACSETPPRVIPIMGYAITDTGDSIFTRVELVPGPPPELRLAPYGEPRLPFRNVRVSNNRSVIDFTWPGRVFDDCRVVARTNMYWLGSCRSGTGERAIAWLRHYQGRSGGDLRPSEVDVRIVETAVSLLSGEDCWESTDDGVCGDGSGPLSLFCALYRSQLWTTGEYLNRRPAMEAVRLVIRQEYGRRGWGDLLRDFNNDRATNRPEVVGVLHRALALLVEATGA